MSIASKLNRIRLTKTEIAQAIEAHGVNMQGVDFEQYAAKISTIQAQAPQPSNIGQMIPTVNGQITEFKMILPEGMVRIYASQFTHNTSTEIVLPSTLLHIEQHAFQLSKIKRMVFPASILTIGSGSFNQSTELEYIEFKGNPTIGSNAFNNTPKLQTAMLHTSQKTIETSMFNTSGLENIDLSNIEKIEENGLAGTKIKQAILPRLTYLGLSALSNASELELIHIGGLIQLSANSSMGYNPKLKVLILDQCRFLGSSTAANNPVLRYVEISNNLQNPVIQGGALSNCPKIEFLVLRSAIKFTAATYFSSNDPFPQANLNLLKIYVNDSLLSAYKSDSTWTKYWNNFYPLSQLPIINAYSLVDTVPPILNNFSITVLEDNSAVVSINTDAAIVQLMNPNNQVIALTKNGNIHSANIAAIIEGEYSLFLQDENFNRMTHNKQVYAYGGIDPLIALFNGGVNGAYINTSNIESMRQDAAGTQAISAVSQTVGRVLDLSGNNNHIIISNVAQQPKIELDSRNKYHLSFDGVDDAFSRVLNRAMAGTAAKTIIFAADGAPSTGVFSSGLYLSMGGWYLQLNGSSNSMPWGMATSINAPSAVVGGVLNLPANTKRFVAGMRLNTADSKHKALFYGFDTASKRVTQEVAKGSYDTPVLSFEMVQNRSRTLYGILIIERELSDAEMNMVYDKFAKIMGATYEP